MARLCWAAADSPARQDQAILKSHEKQLTEDRDAFSLRFPPVLQTPEKWHACCPCFRFAAWHLLAQSTSSVFSDLVCGLPLNPRRISYDGNHNGRHLGAIARFACRDHVASLPSHAALCCRASFVFQTGWLGTCNPNTTLSNKMERIFKKSPKCQTDRSNIITVRYRVNTRHHLPYWSCWLPFVMSSSTNELVIVGVFPVQKHRRLLQVLFFSDRRRLKRALGLCSCAPLFPDWLGDRLGCLSAAHK